MRPDPIALLFARRDAEMERNARPARDVLYSEGKLVQDEGDTVAIGTDENGAPKFVQRERLNRYLHGVANARAR